MLKISDEGLRRKVIGWILDVFYPAPGEIDASDYVFNGDLSELTEEAQREAQQRMRLRLLVDPAPSAWLLRRYRALNDLLDGGRHE